MKKRKRTKRPRRMKRSKRLIKRNLGIGRARDTLMQVEMNPMGVDPSSQVSSSQVSSSEMSSPQVPSHQVLLLPDGKKKLKYEWKISNDYKSNIRMQQSKLSSRKRKWLRNYSIPKIELDDIIYNIYWNHKYSILHSSPSRSEFPTINEIIHILKGIKVKEN